MSAEINGDAPAGGSADERPSKIKGCGSEEASMGDEVSGDAPASEAADDAACTVGAAGGDVTATGAPGRRGRHRGNGGGVRAR